MNKALMRRVCFCNQTERSGHWLEAASGNAKTEMHLGAAVLK